MGIKLFHGKAQGSSWMTLAHLSKAACFVAQFEIRACQCGFVLERTHFCSLPDRGLFPTKSHQRPWTWRYFNDLKSETSDLSLSQVRNCGFPHLEFVPFLNHVSRRTCTFALLPAAFCWFWLVLWVAFGMDFVLHILKHLQVKVNKVPSKVLRVQLKKLPFSPTHTAPFTHVLWSSHPLPWPQLGLIHPTLPVYTALSASCELDKILI
jgi:hypothetical protein